MRDAIIEKLKQELQEPITSERQVVYLLVQIRKLIELKQDGTNYTALKFCCDWVAHPILDRKEAQNIVRQFDKYQELIDEMAAAEHGQRLTTDMGFMKGLTDILRLSKFRSELGEYLRLHGLDSSIATDDKAWASFLTYYARVIEDCPLKCIGQGLIHADEVVLRVIDVKLEDYQLVIEWSWVSKITGNQSVTQQFY